MPDVLSNLSVNEIVQGSRGRRGRYRAALWRNPAHWDRLGRLGWTVNMGHRGAQRLLWGFLGVVIVFVEDRHGVSRRQRFAAQRTTSFWTSQ